MRIEVVREFPDGQLWSERWDALVSRSVAPDAFAGYAWAAAAAAYDPECQPLIICGYVDERLIGIAPFALRRRRRLWSEEPVLEFLTGPWADYCDLIAEPDQQQEFIRRVVEYVAEMLDQENISHLSLDRLPEDSLTLPVMADLVCRRGLRLSLRQSDVSAALDIAGTDNARLDELLEKKAVLRKTRILASKGKLEFRTVRALDEIRDCLSRFCRFHTARYLLNGRPSIYDPDSAESLGRLLEALAGRLSPAEQICLPALFFDDEPIALALCFEYDRTLTLYATTFDAGVINTSPGEILVVEIMRYCRRTGIGKFDFGAGEESYKARFTNTQRRTFQLIAHRGDPVITATKLLADVKAWAKRQPELWEALRSLKSLAQLIRLEARRTSLSRAMAGVAAQHCREWFQLSDDTTSISHASLTELRPRDLVSVVMSYRHDLPAWEFRKAYDSLRQGEACFLVIREGRLEAIVRQPAMNNQEPLGSPTDAAVSAKKIQPSPPLPQARRNVTAR
jgi:CelD/BcsL family acetyltransferase involved in cellulose biosynthesis